MMIMAAASREGKTLRDVVFAAGAAAREAAAQYGADKVVNATVGCYAGDDEKLACLPVVEQLYRSLPMSDFITYAPPLGLEGYRQAVIDETFEGCRPDGYVDAVATSGGTGAIHIAIANYSEVGDAVLTTDWRWNIYDCLCQEIGRDLHTFSMMDDQGHFNTAAFSAAVSNILRRQDSLLLILNTPANNPTGYGLSDSEWDEVLAFLKDVVKGKDKNIIFVSDVAYLDYSGEKHECRKFFKKFGNMPDNVLIVVAYTCSKGFTMYGQRMGAMICVTPNKDIADEFVAINQYTSRATWSNSNSAAMKVMANICKDPAKVAELDAERAKYFHLIQERADLFMKEADECGLKYLRYISGFFITIPMEGSQKVCDELEKENIFLVPLGKGIRLAVCSVSKKKIHGLAAKIKATLDAVGAKQ